jgi:putative restriction endonuclease
MTQVFVFVSGNPDAQRHLADTIENPIDDEMVFDGFPSTYRKDLEGIREEGNGFYAWGAVPGDMNTLRWNQMKQGDYVLSSYDNAYHHAARVLAKYDNRRFAERVWGRDNEGRTWRYMYFLTEPVAIDRRVPEVADYLNAGYRGFTRIRPDKVDAIVCEFGSVDEFIHQVLRGPRGGTGATRVFAPVTQRDIEELDDGEGLDRTEVDRQSTTIKKRLSEPPRLKEGLDPQVRQTKGRARCAAFAIDVKKLYGYRCAICGSELRTPKGNPEVQGAHIYPKGRDGSDDLRNGLCLCRRHHWAMDAGWISVDDNYTILVREDLPDHDDYRFIGEYEGEKIHLPSVAEAAPDAMYLQEHRRLMGFE